MDSHQSESGYDLISCIWELTLKCTMNCMHCGSTAGKARQKELTLDECRRVADELAELGCKELAFIGGEVFLYKGWEKIARLMSDRGLLVNIMTNGYKWGEKEIEQIKYAKLTNVGLSIDGMEANHNRIRGKKDGFAQIKKAMDLLNRENIPIGVVTCLLDFNCDDLEDMYRFFVDNDVNLWQLQLVNPMGKMTGRDNIIIKPTKIPMITQFIADKSRERIMSVIAADSIGYFDENEPNIRSRHAPICYWEGCQSGLSGLCIDSVGNVKGCGALYDDYFIEGNVREQSLIDIWNDENNFAYNRKFSMDLLSGQCQDCDMGDVCRGGCRASNYFTTGSLYANAFCSRHQSEPAKELSISTADAEV